MNLIAVLRMSPQTKPVQQNALASRCVDIEENALQLQIKGTEEAMEYFLSQVIGAVVISVLNSQSGALIFHTNITLDIDIRKLRNKQFLLGLDHVVTIIIPYTLPSKNYNSFFLFVLF